MARAVLEEERQLTKLRAEIEQQVGSLRASIDRIRGAFASPLVAASVAAVPLLAAATARLVGATDGRNRSRRLRGGAGWMVLSLASGMSAGFAAAWLAARATRAAHRTPPAVASLQAAGADDGAAADSGMRRKPAARRPDPPYVLPPTCGPPRAPAGRTPPAVRARLDAFYRRLPAASGVGCRLAVRVLRRYGSDAGGSLAAVVAFNLFLSLFPVTLALSGLAGLLLDRAAVRAGVTGLVASSIPGAAAQAAILSILDGVQQRSVLLCVLGLLGMLASGSSLFAAVEFVFSRIFGFRNRGFLRQKTMALVMTALLAGLLVVAGLAGWIVSAPTLLAGPFAAQRGLIVDVSAIPVLRWAVAEACGFVLGAVFFGATYALVPLPRPDWRAIWPGALLGSLGFQLISYIFPVYWGLLHRANPYGATFGLVFLLFAWMALISQLLVLGAELNAVVAGYQGLTDGVPV